MPPSETNNPFTWELPPTSPPDQSGTDHPSGTEHPSGTDHSYAPAGAVAFGAPWNGVPEPSTDQLMPVWRIDLPADGDMAARQVQQALDQVHSRQAQLEMLPSRFEKLATQLRAGALSAKTASVEGVSFTAPDSVDADSELIAALAQIAESPVKGVVSTKGAVSFGLTERFSSGWEQINRVQNTRDQFLAFTDRLHRTLAYLAWVETCQEGKLIGRTVVGWSGDCDTVWDSAVTSAQMDLHHRSLETALQSRFTLLSTFTTAVQGAVKLSVLLATPGGAILALPTVWKYITQIFSMLDN